MFEKKLPPPIHWHEGMFLQPHHFQQLWHWEEETLTYKSRLLSPYHWGIYRLEIEEEEVARGRFAIKEIDAVLDDGLIVQSHTLSAPLERDLSPFEEELQRGKILPVYLAVPNPGPKAVQIAEGDEATYPLRYRVQSGKVQDESTGSGEAAVDFLKAKGTLLVGDENRSGYETIPVAEVAQAGGVYRLTDYIPPTIIVTKDSPVAAVVRRVCGFLRQEALRQAGNLEGGVRSADAARTLEARFRSLCVGPSLLALEQMVEAEAFRPVDFYLALCRSVAEVNVLTSELMPRNLPRYNHLDLRHVFAALERAVEDATKQPMDWIPLEVEKNAGSPPNSMRFCVKSLRPEHLSRPMCFVVHAGLQADPAALKRWVEHHCTIADRPHLGEWLKRNFPGLERKLFDPPPPNLVMAKGLAYQLVLAGESLEAFKKGEPLWFVSRDPDPGAIERGEAVIPSVLEFYVKRK